MLSMLSLKQFGVAFGERIILRSVDLEVPETGGFVLMGPAGTGKSTLLRTICGINEAAANMRTWGQALYRGEKLGESSWPALVAQNACLIMASIMENIVYELPERQSLTLKQQRELSCRLLDKAGLDYLKNELNSPVIDLPLVTQRHLAIMRTVAANPHLLCIDEPTTGLNDADSNRLLTYIRYLAESKALIVVLHNQQQAQSLDGNCALLAGGWIQEANNIEEFFRQPENKVTREFIRNGICSVPSPNSRPEDLDEYSEHPVPPPIPALAASYVSDAYGPRGFMWLKKGLLAGTPKPGIVIDEIYDLKALQRVKIKVLVSLTEERFDPALLAEYDIESLWLPIVDMDAPTIDEARQMCVEVSKQIAQGKAVAYHCKAGMGRTGTMLAAQLIWEGNTALDALETARKIEPRWVQSEKQLEFLDKFAHAIADSPQSVNRAMAINP